ASNLRVRDLALTRPSGGETGAGAGGRACHNRDATVGSYPKIWMRGGLRVNLLRRERVKFFRGSKSWKEGGEFPSPFPPFPIAPTGMGRDGAGFTTRPRAAMMIRRRTADSAGQSTLSTARWRGFGIRATMASPPS